MKKFKKLISIFAAAAMVFSMLAVTVNAETTALSGEGTEQSPYLISSVDDLKFFRDSVNGGETYKGKFVKLTADINLNNEDWDPIGKGQDSKFAFMGTFDGAKHTISNYKAKHTLIAQTMDADTEEMFDSFFGSALFGRINSATIKNLNVTGAATADAGNIVAAVCGYSLGDSTFENVNVSKSEITGSGKVGGIVGMTNDASTNITFKDCTVKDVTLNGMYNVAGLVGTMQGTINIDGCIVSGITFNKTGKEEKYIDLNTVVSGCSDSGTCAKNGTKIKGLYYQTTLSGLTYAFAAYADLYVKYGSGKHDCKLEGTNALLADSELIYSIPVLENGSGTADDPYIISNADDLRTFRDSVNLGNTYKGKYVKLNADIDLGNEIWNPIGKGNNSAIAFMGTFDGNNKTISNYQTTYTLTANTGVNASGQHTFAYYGSALFGRINSATIKNLNVTGASTYVIGGTSTANITAAVCGYSYGSSVFENVKASNCNISGVGKVSALVGMSVNANSNITLTNCTADNVTLKGGYNVAGLVANMQGNINLSGCKVSDITFERIGADDDYVKYNTVATDKDNKDNKVNVKGLYWKWNYQGKTYIFGAYADLYIKATLDDSISYMLDETTELANCELVNNLPSVEISDTDAYIGEDGQGNLRFISDVTLPANTKVTTFGTWIIPEDIFDTNNSLTIEKDNLTDDTFAADLLEIPSTQLDRKIVGTSYIVTEYGTVSSGTKTATVKGSIAQ